MAGGLFQIVAYGASGIFLNGNPSKTFFNAVYKKYTNFGLQRFRIDHEGQRYFSFDVDTSLDFKLPRYAELMWDTYIVVNLPDIWSPFFPRPGDVSGGAIPYEFQWIKKLGFNMIRRVLIHSGGVTLGEYSGEWMQNAIERDEGGKKDLVDRMIGHVPELYDPANAFGRKDVYPNAIYDPSCVDTTAEPSIRGRKLYIPLMAWFCYGSKVAFPLVALQYQEIWIRVEFRPIRELFTIRHVLQEEIISACPQQRALPDTGLAKRIAPNTGSITDQLYLFIQPPPKPTSTANPTWVATYLEYLNKTNTWNSDIHLISTYVFLSNDERRQFAAKPHNYLIKSQHEHDLLNATGSKQMNIPSNNLISSYMFRFRRSDVNLRNEWSNYTNWEFENELPQQVMPFDGSNAVPSGAVPSGGGVYPLNPLGWMVTGCRTSLNIKDILIDLGILFGGEYRESVHDSGIYNYMEKWYRTSGTAKDGLYMYNFCIDSNRTIYQPSGAQDTNKWQYITFEFNTIQPPTSTCKEDQGIQILCDGSGAIIGVRKESGWTLNEYNYDLRIFEERYNMIKIIGGRIGLMFAR